MNILHDFNLGLKHFTFPFSLFKKIEKKGYKLVDYKTSSKIEKESCEIFLEIESQLNAWILSLD